MCASRSVFCPAVEVGFTQQMFLVMEGEESVEITINKTGQNSQIFDVAFTTEDGTAMCELIILKRLPYQSCH